MKKKKDKPLAEPVLIDDQDLPDGWTKKTLLEVAGGASRLVVGGPFGSCLKVDDYQKSGVPIIRLQNVGHAKFIDKDIKYLTLEKAKELEYHTFIKGDLVLAKLGDPIGKTCIIPDKFEWGIVVSDVVRIRIENDQIDKKYLLYYLNSSYSINQISSQVFGSTRPRVNLKEVRDIVILVPPLAEQQRIVARVEALLTQVNAARERLSRVPLIMKKFRQAVLATACSGRLTEGWRTDNRDVIPSSNAVEFFFQNLHDENALKILQTRSKQAEITSVFDGPFKIPKSWCWARIEDLAAIGKNSITDGPFGSNLKTEHYSQSGPRVIRLQNIGNGQFIDIKTHISQSHFEKLHKHEIFPGDIAIGLLGDPIPRSCIIPENLGPAVVKADCIRFKPNSDLVLTDFLNYVINEPELRSQVKESVHGVARPRLNLAQIKIFHIPLPPLAEQHEIVKRVGLLFERADAIDREVAAAGRQCERMTQAVLARAFAGRL